MTVSRLLAAGLLAALGPTAALADGEYWGIDVSAGTINGVLAATRGDLTFGVTATDYGDGVSAGLSLARAASFDFGVPGLQLSAGPAVGFGGGDLSELTLGLTASAQRWVPTEFGNYFLQANINSVDRAFFLQAQLGFRDPGVVLGVSYGGSTEYHETSVSVSKRLGDSPVSLRAGYLFNAGEWFVGFSVNTF